LNLSSFWSLYGRASQRNRTCTWLEDKWLVLVSVFVAALIVFPIKDRMLRM